MQGGGIENYTDTRNEASNETLSVGGDGDLLLGQLEHDPDLGPKESLKEPSCKVYRSTSFTPNIPEIKSNKLNFILRDFNGYVLSFMLSECDERCYHHGQCEDGVCKCLIGWNGKFCTIPGCPNDCNNHGSCEQGRSDLQRGSHWACKCDPGFTGHDCKVKLEQNCQDDLDNDNGETFRNPNLLSIAPLGDFWGTFQPISDGLIDCEDPECCSSKHCHRKHLCMTVQDPSSIDNPGDFTNFWERIKFLVGAKGIQRYAQFSAFDPR